MPAFAPNTPPGVWAQASLPVTFSFALPLGRDVGADAIGELRVALRTWPEVACTAYRTAYGGERAATAADDGQNFVFFHDDAWPAELLPDVVAQTVVTLDADGHIHDTDIHLNSHAYRFSLDGAPGTQDLRSVLVHELGHALGLGHTTVPNATMTVTGSGLRWRSLEKDDIDGVCSLYPGTGTAGCDVVACPDGFRCVADVCQRPGEKANVCSPCERVVGACEGSGDDARCIDYPGGLACARACTTDAACGAGFHCRATTAAGDLQCVADDQCGLVAVPEPGSEPLPSDAGTTTTPPPSDDGCSAAPGPVFGPIALVFGVALLSRLVRRAR